MAERPHEGRRSRGRWCVSVLAALLLVAASAPACGGTGSEAAGSVTTTTAPRQTTTSAAPTPDTEATTTSTIATVSTVAISDFSIVYAEDLGGTSHLGEELYLVVGATTETQEDAQMLLEGAFPLFGDMQSYFIVQHSDNFDGLEPGRWVVIEAYRDKPSEENTDFARRAFPDAVVESAVVLTSDPIPVYEDLVEH